MNLFEALKYWFLDFTYIPYSEAVEILHKETGMFQKVWQKDIDRDRYYYDVMKRVSTWVDLVGFDNCRGLKLGKGTFLKKIEQQRKLFLEHEDIIASIYEIRKKFGISDGLSDEEAFSEILDDLTRSPSMRRYMKSDMHIELIKLMDRKRNFDYDSRVGYGDKNIVLAFENRGGKL